MTAIWIGLARHSLLRWRRAGSGWGHRPDSAPSVEPTVLATLALSASSQAAHGPDSSSAVAEAVAWLEALQHADGSLGLSETLPAPHWNTALGLLVWLTCGAREQVCRRAESWLLGLQGIVGKLTPGVTFAHDPTIPGWPWVEGTHSWLEPTACAVLALDRAGLRQHSRVAEGRRLIRDRAACAGGWNYGNSQVFGTDLRPQPGPTGLALLALAGCDDADAPRIDRACAYLERVLPTTRAPQSLCWGLLGLAAWGGRPQGADAWLEAAFDKAAGRSDQPAQVSYLLLAAAPQTLEYLGPSKAGGRPENGS